VNPPKEATYEDVEFALRMSLKTFSQKNSNGEDDEAEFISYQVDEENDNHEFVFKIPHYSEWGVNWAFIEKKQPPLATIVDKEVNVERSKIND
jgi:cytochrome oxidase Cu insertion factor (SCO1/SenC/PrrC family)